MKKTYKATVVKSSSSYFNWAEKEIYFGPYKKEYNGNKIECVYFDDKREEYIGCAHSLQAFKRKFNNMMKRSREERIANTERYKRLEEEKPDACW